jgi:hypothetical protein
MSMKILKGNYTLIQTSMSVALGSGIREKRLKRMLLGKPKKNLELTYKRFSLIVMLTLDMSQLMEEVTCLYYNTKKIL